LFLVKNGCFISCDKSGTVLPKANMIIKNDRIVEVTTREIISEEGFSKVIDATGKIIIPGLVNAHIHSYANFVKGILENLPLEMWMVYIFTQGRCMEPEDIYYNTLLGCIEMLKTGTTACVDHLAQGFDGLEAAMQAYYDAGMRGTIAPMISDKLYYETLPLEKEKVPEEMKKGNPPDAEELIDNTVKLFKKWDGKDGRLRVAFGPSGPQRCSDELLAACARLAEEYDTGFHSHVLETSIQAETADFLYGKLMIKHLDELGCLNERASLVHGVWLTDTEAQIAADRGAIVVHNPASNLMLGSGIAPINRYRDLGLDIAIGTDGANCGGNLNMFEAMKLTAILHKVSKPKKPEKWLTAKEVLRMATYNGAKVALIEKEVGSLEKGKKADFVILNPLKSPAMIPVQNPLWQIVYSENGLSVETVVINGQVVLDKGEVTMFDEEKVYREAEKRATRVVERSLAYKEIDDKQVAFIKKALFENF